MAAKDKENPKAFWRYVNSKTKSRSGVADLKKAYNTLIVSDMEKAELLNSFFQSVYTIEDEELLADMPIYKVKEDLVDMEIDQKKVKELLTGLQTDKAAGPDGIPPAILLRAADQLAELMTQLFRCTLDEGQLPDDWKLAFVTPVFKKGSRSLASNYRPVSLTCIA